MFYTGEYNILKVNRISDNGLYLADEEGNEVLLPNRYVSIEDKEGDQMEVFVYHDSEDRLIATTHKPLIKVGEAAFLKVVGQTVHGAFLDWGLEAKDLFLPKANMLGLIAEGHYCVVYAYRDTVSDRVVATMRLNSCINNETQDIELERGQEVEILVALTTEQGFRVVINNRYWGMVYDNQIFQRINIGDRLTAYVRQITDDHRIDLSLQQEGYNQVKSSADILLDLLHQNNGSIPLNDDSSPEQIRRATNMSKKVFKRVVGFLMKKEVIEQTERGIRLIKR